MSDQKITGLVNKNTSEDDWVMHVVDPLDFDQSVDGSSYKQTKGNFLKEIKADVIKSAPYGGAIIPTDSPINGDNRYWHATEPGTYTNFGGIVVPVNTLATISLLGGVFSKSETSIDIGYVGLGTLLPSGTPVATPAKAFFLVNQAGTYTNAGGVVLPANSIGYILRDAGGAYSITYTAVDLSDYTKLLTYKKEVFGDFFIKNGFYLKNTGTGYENNVLYKCTPEIAFTNADVLTVMNTTKGGSLSDVTFLDSSKAIVGVFNKNSSSINVFVNVTPIPATTAYIVVNALVASTAAMKINGNTNINDRLIAVENRLNTEIDSLITTTNYDRIKNFGDYFVKKGFFFHKTTGIYMVLGSLKSTDYIPFIQGDVLIATGTGKGGSYNNITFLDSTKGVISGVDLQTNVLTLSVNSTNTPANTAYIVMNAMGTDITKVTINGYNSLSELIANNTINITALSNTFNTLSNDYGSYFTESGYRDNTTGVFVTHGSFKSTKLLPFTNLNTLLITGTSSGASYANINFYASDGVTLISGLSYQSSVKYINLSGSSIPATTAFIALNALKTSITNIYIDKKTSLGMLKSSTITHQLNGLIWDSFGDSKTAANNIQNHVLNYVNLDHQNKGIGSSGVFVPQGNCAVTPDGIYISRIYGAGITNITQLEADLASKGYTQLATPSWLSYRANPTGFTLVEGDYFIITATANSDDRIATLRTTAQVINVSFGTNDIFYFMNHPELTDANLGTIDSYGNNDGGLTFNFIGAYREMLQKIHTRCPKARLVLTIPDNFQSEYDYLTKKRTANGIIGDKVRDAIKLIGETYGYILVDYRKAINHITAPTDLSDGIHQKNGIKLGQQLLQGMAKISYEIT